MQNAIDNQTNSIVFVCAIMTVEEIDTWTHGGTTRGIDRNDNYSQEYIYPFRKLKNIAAADWITWHVIRMFWATNEIGHEINESQVSRHRSIYI